MEEVVDANEQVEIKAYERLKEVFPKDSTYIVHQCMVSNGIDQPKEIDILILDKYNGIHIVEVKAWDLHYLKNSTADNKYIYINSKKHKNPYKQSREYTFFILELLKKRFNTQQLNYTISNFVMFPNLTKKEFNDLDITMQNHIPITNVIFKLENKEKILEKFTNISQSLFSSKNLNEYNINKIREILFPELSIYTNTNDLDDVEIQLMDLKQESILRKLKYGTKILRGAPGSGKSIVLVGKSIYEKLYYPNKKILFLTYNKFLNIGIKNNIKSIIEKRDLDISIDDFEINHFDKFAKDFLNKLGINEKIDFGQYADFLAKKIDNLEIDNYLKYDVIICDESQDIKKEWFKFITKLKKNKDSLLLFGLDETQRIYENTEWRWIDVGIDATGHNTKILKNIYRCPSNIINNAIKFIKKDEVLFKQLKELELDDNTSLNNKENSIHVSKISTNTDIKEIVEYYIYHDYNYSDIFILTNSTKSAKSKELLSLIPNSVASNKVEPYDLDNSLIISTYHSSKGLERKVVIIDNLYQLPGYYSDTIDKKRKDRRLAYVALTRAKEKLHILYNNKNNDSFIDDIVEIFL